MTPTVGDQYYSTTNKGVTCRVKEVRETVVISTITSEQEAGTIITDAIENFFDHWGFKP